MQAVKSSSKQHLYSVDDIRNMLGIGRNSAYKLIKQEGFPAIHVGNRIVTPSDLFHTWIAAQASLEASERIDSQAGRRG